MAVRAPSSFGAFLVAEGVRRTRKRRALRATVDQWQDERTSLRSYIPVVHRTDEGQPAYPPKHLLPIIDAIENDELGNTVIVAPPGSAKTTTVIAAAAFWLGNDPAQHMGLYCNVDAQAAKRSLAIRSIVTNSTDYRAIFPDVRPSPDGKWTEREWTLDRGREDDKDSTMLAAGVGSAIIQGSRQERQFYDDIAYLKNMATTVQREKVTTWLRESAVPRLSPTGRAVAIATRWHTEDPVAWMLAQGWRLIRVKAVNENGESYWPERWPINMLACPGDVHGVADPDWQATEEQVQPPCWVIRNDEGRIVKSGRCAKVTMGTRSFNLVMQGETSDEDSAIFKRAYWRYYDEEQLAGVSKAIVGIFVDMAHKEGEENDYTVISPWRFHPPNFFCEEVIRGRFTFPQLRAMLKRMVTDEGSRYRYWPIVIEETTGSTPLIQTLEQEVPGVTPWAISGRSKLARAHAIEPYAEAGNFYLPKTWRDAAPGRTQPPPWLFDFLEECAQFPSGEHDDQVDMLTMMGLQFTKGGTGLSW